MKTITYIMCGLVTALTVALCLIDPPASYLIGAFYAGFGAGVLLCLYADLIQKIIDRLLKD